MEKLLLSNTTAKYFIQRGDYLVNHISQGLIALHRLGATGAQLENFAQSYGSEQHPADKYPEQHKTSEVDFNKLLGKRQSFYCLVEHYEKKFEEKSSDNLGEFVGEEFPKLSRGLVGSALHGLIHTGYGYAARSARIVCEGLAYLHFSSVPLRLSSSDAPSSFLGHGTSDPFEVLDMLRQDNELYEFMEQSIDKGRAYVKNNSPYQTRVAMLMMERGDRLSQYVCKLKLPETINIQSRDSDELKALVKWVLDCAVLVYLTAETRNHFFLLHGVTGAWGLYNVIDTVRDFDAAVDAVHTFLCALLATYLTVGRPRLLPDLATALCDAPWSELVERTVSSELDEHIYKVVQVCHDMVAADDGGMERVYRLAAHCALTHELKFIK